MITDVTICDGGNHLTFFVDGNEWRTFSTDELSPDLTHYQIAQYIKDQKEEDVELIYNIILATRAANARTLEEIKTALGVNT